MKRGIRNTACLSTATTSSMLAIIFVLLFMSSCTIRTTFSFTFHTVTPTTPPTPTIPTIPMQTSYLHYDVITRSSKRRSQSTSSNHDLKSTSFPLASKPSKPKPFSTSALAAATSSTTTIISNHPTILTQIKTVIKALSNTNAYSLHAFQELLHNTSPMIYFSCLILAGLGVPFSEDALCIFVGSILHDTNSATASAAAAAASASSFSSSRRRLKLICALYVGVVLSDVITFSIGKVMGKGLLEPLRKRLKLRTERIDFCDDDTNDMDIMIAKDDGTLTEEQLILQNEITNQKEGKDNKEEEGKEEDDGLCEIPTPELQAKDNILAILEKVGNYAGFVVRFAIGMRLPMMLATGFSGKVSMTRFLLGSSIGAVGSLSLQLGIGHILRNRPALILALLAAISTFPLLMPTLFAFGSWLNLMYLRWTMYKPKKSKRLES